MNEKTMTEASFQEVAVKHNVLTGFNRIISVALVAVVINIADSLTAHYGDYDDVYVLGGAAVMLLVSLWLHKRYSLAAKIISALVFNVTLLFMTIHMGIKIGAYLYYFPFILAYIYLFRNEGKKKYVIIFSVITIVFLFVSLFFSDHNFQYPPEKIAEEKRSFYLSFFVSFSLTVYYFILIYNYQEKLYRHILLLEANNKKQKLRAVIEKQEADNQDIVYELRNDINQTLAAANVYLSEAIAKNEHNELLEKSYVLTNDALNAVTRMCIKLHPAVIADIGLIDGIREYIVELKKVKNIHIRFAYNELAVETISQNDKFSVFRIIQDYVDIVLNNSAATEVLINIWYKPLHITLVLSQNDITFDVTHAIQTSAQNTIYNRITYFNGVVRRKIDRDNEISVIELFLS